MTDSLFGIVLPDRLLWFVALLSTVFFFSSFSLVTTVVGLRIRNLVRQRRWRAAEAKWGPLIMDVMLGDEPESALHACVGPRRGQRVCTGTHYGAKCTCASASEGEELVLSWSGTAGANFAKDLHPPAVTGTQRTHDASESRGDPRRLPPTKPPRKL